jgi:hypothetical protein
LIIVKADASARWSVSVTTERPTDSLLSDLRKRLGT